MKYTYDASKEELIETKDIQPLPEVKTTLNITKPTNEKKKSAAKPTYFFDTVEGVNHVTKTLETHENLKSNEAKLLNKEMKLGVLSNEVAGIKKFDHHDKSSYMSDPEQKRRILNISKLEKDLGYTYNPPKLENSPILKNNINNIKTKKIKPLDLGSISKSLLQLKQSRKHLNDLRRSDLRAKQKYESIVNRPDPDQYKGIGSILNLPRRKL